MSDDAKGGWQITGITTLRQLLSRVTCFCPRCNTRLKLSPVGKELQWHFVRALLDGKRFSIPGYLTIELESHGGHWQPQTLIPHWPWVRHKPFWNPGYLRLLIRARSSLRWQMRRLRKKTKPRGKPPTDWR